MSAANANYNQTITAVSAVDLFKSSVLPNGGQIATCTAISIQNTGAGDALLWVKGHHGEDDTAAPMFLLPSGKSVTFTVETENNYTSAIQHVRAKAASGTTQLAWGVVSRR
jgi:hypothetical protein